MELPEESLPTVLYRSPGVNPGPGGTWDSAGATTQEEFDKLIKEGWHPSLVAAIQAAQLENPLVDPNLPSSTSTPAEKAAAAKKALSVAADKANVANRTLAADEGTAAGAKKELTQATDKAFSAAMAAEDAIAASSAAAAEKARASEKSVAADKALSSSKLRAEAAKRILNDAAGRVLTADNLLAAATEKALAEAAAAEAALAAAAAGEKKGKKPPEPEPDPPKPTKGRML